MVVLLAACSTGPAAPAIDGVDLACSEGFCVTYPVGWAVEHGDVFLAFTHEAAPGVANATISPLNLQAVVENAGGTWPAPTEEVVRGFWLLLEEGDSGSFERLERLTGGAFRSEGSHQDGRLWHLLIPGEGNRGIAIEVRGPNRSWESHADVFFSNVEVLG